MSKMGRIPILVLGNPADELSCLGMGEYQLAGVGIGVREEQGVAPEIGGPVAVPEIVQGLLQQGEVVDLGSHVGPDTEGQKAFLLSRRTVTGP